MYVYWMFFYSFDFVFEEFVTSNSLKFYISAYFVSFITDLNSFVKQLISYIDIFFYIAFLRYSFYVRDILRVAKFMPSDDPLQIVSAFYFYFYSSTNGISVMWNYSGFSPVSCYSAIVYSLFVYFYYSNEDFNYFTKDYSIFFIFVLFFYI